MSNSLVVNPETSDLLAGNSNPFLTDAGPGGLIFGEYIKFVKEGRIIDRDKDDVIDIGDVFIPHMMGLRHGWACWKEAKKVDEVIILVASGDTFPAESTLPNHGPYKEYADGTTDGWAEYYEVPMIVELEDGSASQYTLQLSSKSGVNGMKSLLREYGGKYIKKIGEDGNLMFPVVEFDTTGFTIKDNPKAGTIYAPKFSIVDWANASEIAALFDGLEDMDSSEDPDNYEGDKEQAALPAPEAETPAPVEAAPRKKRAGKKASTVETAEPAAGDDEVDADVVTPTKPAARNRRNKPRNV